MSKKVLIVHASAGLGHQKAAEALVEGFKAKHPDITIKLIDILKHTPRLWEKFYRDGYNFVSAKVPFIWNFFYKGSNNYGSQKTLNFFSNVSIRPSFLAAVREFSPDFFLASHPLPVKLGIQSEPTLRRTIFGTVITDFGAHRYWLSNDIDYYFVASDEVAKSIIALVQPSQQVIATGIPIELKFSAALNKEVILKRLGLMPNQPIFLIVGGQFGFKELKKIISGIKAAAELQFIVVAGRDKQLQQDLDRTNLGSDPRVKIFGFVDNMHELMTVSDLIFSKAGGLTTSECMAKGIPMVIYKVIPGQEEFNLDYLVKKGVAIKVDDIDDIISAVPKLLKNSEKLAAMKTATQAIGRPAAAIDIADFVYQKIK